MKKGYYIYFALSKNQAGVRRKIDGQIKVLRQYFDVCEIEIKKRKIHLVQGIISRLPFGSYAMDYDAVLTQIDRPDFIYIRHKAVDRRYALFLRQIRKKYSNIKIILEIPTYPYKDELLTNKTMWPFYFKDVFRRSGLRTIADRIVTFTDDDVIFGIPTIKTQNGIEVDAVVPVHGNQNLSEIHLIAVAALLPGHGYERCILGLADYYGDKNNDKKIIKIHIVGEGEELDYYKKLVDKYKLDQYVIFYGKKTGEELDQIYDNKDIALGSFGSYKVGLFHKSSTLKVREYLAKGLPLVSENIEDVFHMAPEYPYFMQVPNDSSTVNMDEIVQFYERIYGGKVEYEQVHSEIRNFAKRNVDMKVVMKPIVSYLQEG